MSEEPIEQSLPTDRTPDEEIPTNSVFIPPVLRTPPQTVGGDLRKLTIWLYTNNPFYVISAALVLIGLWRSFGPGASAALTGALSAGLAGYTLLLAATAWFLIRYGKLWQDARTLLVLIVFLLLALSITCDDLLATKPDYSLANNNAWAEESLLGVSLALGGLLFAVALSESLLRGIRLRLPLGFRLPYYVVLALFFLYPVALSPWVNEPHRETFNWALFGFSTLSGVAFLTLVPAVRRGADYVADNGSPWRWPAYPWVLFGALGLGVCFRAYYLCISFHGVTGTQTIFRPWFLVPFLWAVMYLLLEIGLVSKRKPVIYVSLASPIVLGAMAVTASPDRAGDLGFLQMFHTTMGVSPLFVTLLAVAPFYAIARLRGVRQASVGLLLSVAALSVCGPDTFNDQTISGPYTVPILLVGLAVFVAGIVRWQALVCVLGGWCVVLGLAIQFRETPFASYHNVIPVHMFVAWILVIGAVFRDQSGKLIRNLGAVTLLVLALAAMCPARVIGNPPQALLTLYPLVLAGFAVAYGFAFRSRWYYGTAAGSLAGWLLVPGWAVFCHARRTLAGLDYLAWGGASFLFALLLSLVKMGAFRRLFNRSK